MIRIKDVIKDNDNKNDDDDDEEKKENKYDDEIVDHRELDIESIHGGWKNGEVGKVDNEAAGKDDDILKELGSLKAALPDAEPKYAIHCIETHTKTGKLQQDLA